MDTVIDGSFELREIRVLDVKRNDTLFTSGARLPKAVCLTSVCEPRCQYWANDCLSLERLPRLVEQLYLINKKNPDTKSLLLLL